MKLIPTLFLLSIASFPFHTLANSTTCEQSALSKKSETIMECELRKTLEKAAYNQIPPPDETHSIEALIPSNKISSGKLFEFNSFRESELLAITTDSEKLSVNATFENLQLQQNCQSIISKVSGFTNHDAISDVHCITNTNLGIKASSYAPNQSKIFSKITVQDGTKKVEDGTEYSGRNKTTKSSKKNSFSVITRRGGYGSQTNRCPKAPIHATGVNTKISVFGVEPWGNGTMMYMLDCTTTYYAPIYQTKYKTVANYLTFDKVKVAQDITATPLYYKNNDIDYSAKISNNIAIWDQSNNKYNPNHSKANLIYSKLVGDKKIKPNTTKTITVVTDTDSSILLGCDHHALEYAVTGTLNRDTSIYFKVTDYDDLQTLLSNCNNSVELLGQNLVANSLLLDLSVTNFVEEYDIWNQYVNFIATRLSTETDNLALVETLSSEISNSTQHWSQLAINYSQGDAWNINSGNVQNPSGGLAEVAYQGVEMTDENGIPDYIFATEKDLNNAFVTKSESEDSASPFHGLHGMLKYGLHDKDGDIIDPKLEIFPTLTIMDIFKNSRNAISHKFKTDIILYAYDGGNMMNALPLIEQYKAKAKEGIDTAIEKAKHLIVLIDTRREKIGSDNNLFDQLNNSKVEVNQALDAANTNKSVSKTVSDNDDDTIIQDDSDSISRLPVSGGPAINPPWLNRSL